MSTATWRASRVAYADVVRLAERLAIAEPLAWVLVRRGLADPEAAREFLAADGPLSDPGEIAGVDEAAGRIALAIDRHERIVVHGDYDCDGIVSTALLVSALRAHGADVGHLLPCRFTEGYGVALSSVERLAEERCRLLVCVDCGTSAVDSLTRAVELGMDCVVIDHHLGDGVRPPAIIANPALGRARADLPAAAGVVHHLVRALAGLRPGGVLVPDPADDLDLIALATVADAVPLVGDNRRMVVRGIERLRASPRPAIVALCAAAGTEPRLLGARSLGFTLAPGINAAGRLAHPDRALELLLAPDTEGAMPIARELWQLNLERRDVERAITEQAIAMVEAEPPEIRDAPVVVAAGEGWHEGVVGIVASRLVEHFGRPAIVVSREGERAKGSGRSLPGIDLHSLVGGASATLSRWGGHAGAIGLELPAARVDAFRHELIGAARGIGTSIAAARMRPVDAVVGCPQLTLELAEAFEALAPFGRGNPAVRLAVPAVRLQNPRRVGQGRHLEVRVEGGRAHARAIGFDMGSRAGSIDPQTRHDLVVALEVERWQGMVGPRVRLRALDSLGSVGAPDGTIDTTEAIQGAPERRPVTGEDIDAVLAGADERPIPAPSSPPLGVRDLRGEEAAVQTITALAGADSGVLVVVADLSLRATAVHDVLVPARTGVEVIDQLDTGMTDQAIERRLTAAHGRPAFIVAEYGALAGRSLPGEMHIAALDPPALPADDAVLAAIAADRWLHLLWGPDEVAAALAGAERAWALRPIAAEVWRTLRDGRPRVFGPELDAELLRGSGRPAAPVTRALAALIELGLLAREASGLRAVPEGSGGDIDGGAVGQHCLRMLASARARLADWTAFDPLRPPTPVRDIVHP